MRLEHRFEGGRPLSCVALLLHGPGDRPGARIYLMAQFDARCVCARPGYEMVSPTTALNQLAGWYVDSAGMLDEFLGRVCVGWEYERNRTDARRHIKDLILSGNLVGVREIASGPQREVSVEDRRLVREIAAAHRARLHEGGREYKLCAGDDVAGIADRDEYQVVPRDEAGRALEAMASVAAGEDLPRLLLRARDRLSPDWRPPLPPKGIVLLRRLVRRVSVARNEPSITPSKMKKLIEERERGTKRVSFVLELRTDDGYPIPVVAYEATLANGEVRTGVLERDGTALLADVPPGPVLVRYPDDDDVSAKAWAVYARRALDRQDFFPVFSLLQRSPTSLRQVIQAYDKYYNDYTGAGFLQDLDTVFTDPDAHTTVATLLASAKIAFNESIELIDWDGQGSE